MPVPARCGSFLSLAGSTEGALKQPKQAGAHLNWVNWVNWPQTDGAVCLQRHSKAPQRGIPEKFPDLWVQRHLALHCLCKGKGLEQENVSVSYDVSIAALCLLSQGCSKTCSKDMFFREVPKIHTTKTEAWHLPSGSRFSGETRQKAHFPLWVRPDFNTWLPELLPSATNTSAKCHFEIIMAAVKGNHTHPDP